MRSSGRPTRRGPLISALVATLAAATVAGCAAIMPSPAASPSPLPTPGEIHVEAISVRLARLQGVGPYLPTVTLYEGGLLLTLNERSEIAERRLAPRGVDLIRQAILETGLFERGADYWIEIRKGVEPPGMEVPVDSFTFATGDGTVEVTSVPFEDPTWLVPSPERAALADLAERLVDLSWLPDDAWAQRDPTPYAAAAFLLLSGDLPIVSEVDPAAPDMAHVAWPFPGSPEQLGGPFRSADGAGGLLDRCMVIGPEARAALSAALRAGGAQDLGPAHALSAGVWIPWRARGIEIEIGVRPLLPEETPSCAGKTSSGFLAP